MHLELTDGHQPCGVPPCLPWRLGATSHPHRLVWLAGWIAPAWACIWVLNLHPASSSAVTFFSGFPPRGLQSAARMLITLIHLPRVGHGVGVAPAELHLLPAFVPRHRYVGRRLSQDVRRCDVHSRLRSIDSGVYAFSVPARLPGVAAFIKPGWPRGPFRMCIHLRLLMAFGVHSASAACGPTGVTGVVPMRGHCAALVAHPWYASVSTSCVASWVYRRCVSRHGSILDLHPLVAWGSPLLMVFRGVWWDECT